MVKRKWLLLAFLLTFTLPAAALGAPYLTKALLWRFGPDPAVSVLQGEHWGRIICGVLLTAMPFAPLACFLLERAAMSRARRRRESARPPEFATAEERRAFYLRELEEERREPPKTPWIAYAALCGLGVLVFGFGVLGFACLGKSKRPGGIWSSIRPEPPPSMWAPCCWLTALCEMGRSRYRTNGTCTTIPRRSGISSAP